MDELDRTALYAALLLVAVCGLFACVRPAKKRNRKHNLPPPSSACRRNSTEAVP